MAYQSRVNGLKLSTSPKQAASPAGTFVTNLGTLGAKVNPLKPSNKPGPMTAPSAQGPTRSGSK